MGVYNAKNVELVRIHALQDSDDEQYFDGNDVIHDAEYLK